MSWNFFKKGFLSAFDPFKSPPKRDKAADTETFTAIEGEFSVVNDAEELMHKAFSKALCDVKQAT